MAPNINSLTSNIFARNHQRIAAAAAVYLSVFLLIALDAAGLPVDGDVLVAGERPVAVVATKVLQMP